MRKLTMKIYRGMSLMLALFMVLGVFCVIPLKADAAPNVTKTEKSYDIAVVYDNSGSMYNNKSWCQAKYAMEIFASMINYGKDKLHIFPMWRVHTDGTQKDEGGSYDKFEIRNKDEIDKISNMYTVYIDSNVTPFEPVKEAYEYLQKSSSDERWLIILTDGEFDRRTRDQEEKEIIDLQKELAAMNSPGIKIQYLGFGSAGNLEEKGNLRVKKSTGASLKDDLIDICNDMFERSELKGRLSGDKLKIDLSMKNIIVFVQGENAKINSLTNSNGQTVAKTLDSGQRKYSEIGATNKNIKDKIDKTLAGQVVTFAACPKGEYTLSCTGVDASKVKIFYEPDVDIDISLIHKSDDGEETVIKDASQGVPAGNYTITSKIVDAVTGEDVTNHELLGGNVNLKTYVKTSKDGDYTDRGNPAEVELDPDSDTKIYVEGTYLEKYKISSRNDPRWSWLTAGFSVEYPSVDFKITSEVLQPDALYKIAESGSWKPVKVSVTLDGKPLDDEALKKINMSVTATGDIKCVCEMIPGESAYNIYVGKNENGEFVEPVPGEYQLSISAGYEDEYGKKVPASASASFTVQGAELVAKIEMLQDASWYTLTERDTWKPIKVTLTLDGQPLTPEQMANAKLAITVSNDLKYRLEQIEGEPAYYIYVAQDEDGNNVEPITGEYELAVTASYINEQGVETKSAVAEDTFDIQQYSVWVRRLIVIAITLAIIAFIVFIIILLHLIKVFPNNVGVQNPKYTKDGAAYGGVAAHLTGRRGTIFKKTGTIAINTTKGGNGISLNVETVHPLFKPVFNYQNSLRRKYRIKGISAGGVDYVTINGQKYTPDQFKDVNEIGDDLTTVEYKKISAGHVYIVKAELVNK